MSHWAQIDENNIVINVLVGDNDDPNGDEGLQFFTDTHGGTWIKTSYNTNGGVHIFDDVPIRKNYAGVGMIYDKTRDAFYWPQPYPSYILNEDSCIWEAPVPYPTDGQFYVWDETIKAWILTDPLQETN